MSVARFFGAGLAREFDDKGLRLAIGEGLEGFLGFGERVKGLEALGAGAEFGESLRAA